MSLIIILPITFKVSEHTKRLGCEEMGGYGHLKAHPFFEPIVWENLHLQTPPKLTAYLPAMSEDEEECYGNVSINTLFQKRMLSLFVQASDTSIE